MSCLRYPTLLGCGILFFLGINVLSAKPNADDYVNLYELSKALRTSISFSDQGKRAELKSAQNNLSFRLHKRDFTINGRQVYLGHAVTKHKGDLCILKQDYYTVILPILAPQIQKKPRPIRHIVIDPGHGGKDEGTLNKQLGLKEKQLALDVALRLEKILKEAGYKVTLTRRSDTFIPLAKRSEMANRLHGDIFLSIHFNAVASNKNKVSGTEVYTLPAYGEPSTSRAHLESGDKKQYPGNRYNTWNTVLGFNVQSALIKNLHTKDRGLKKARFAVLKNLQCPGVLIESAFVTNDTEGRRIAKAAFRQSIAESIAEGVHYYQAAAIQAQRAG